MAILLGWSCMRLVFRAHSSIISRLLPFVELALLKQLEYQCCP